MAESILIGTRGWDHPGWSGGFYPDALPPDWRFSFYCNQLRSVLVPAEAWSARAAAEVRAWAEDAFPEFRFVVELSATSPLSLDILEPIRSQVAGLLLRAPATPDRDWLAARLAELTASFPLCVDLPPEARTPDLLACLTQYDAGLCWRTEIEPEPRPGGKLMVALASAAAPSARGERSFGNGRSRAIPRAAPSACRWNERHYLGRVAAVSEWPPPRVARAFSAVVARRLRENCPLWRTGASLRRSFASEGSRPIASGASGRAQGSAPVAGAIGRLAAGRRPGRAFLRRSRIGQTGKTAG